MPMHALVSWYVHGSGAGNSPDFGPTLATFRHQLIVLALRILVGSSLASSHEYKTEEPFSPSLIFSMSSFG